MNYGKILGMINLKWLTKKSFSISLADMKKVIANLGKIYEKAKNDKNFNGLLGDIKTLGSMIKDYFDGTYTEIPWKVIASAVFALLYVLMPLDLIPDFIFGVGYIDDAAVVGLVIKLLSGEISEYKEWKSKN